MKKVIIVSDSHGTTKELNDIYEHYKSETQYFIHCGDSELDEEHPLFTKYLVVNGNCDDNSFVSERVITILNKRILVTHGHLYSVMYDLNSLYYHALENNCQIVCFGHTHNPLFIKGDVIFINPGSIFANRGIRGRTFAVLEIYEDKITVNHYDLHYNLFQINE